MKKSIALFVVLVGLSMSSFAADSPLNRERKKKQKSQIISMLHRNGQARMQSSLLKRRAKVLYEKIKFD